MIRKAVYVGGREVWKFMMTRPAKKGTMTEMLGSIAAAVVVGLISWWGYSHR